MKGLTLWGRYERWWQRSGPRHPPQPPDTKTWLDYMHDVGLSAFMTGYRIGYLRGQKKARREGGA